MRKISFVAFVVLLMSGCNMGPKFTVTGEVTGADGKKIYLEASRLSGVIVLDSAKIKANGAYAFKHQRPEAPEFYRLRVDDKIINFSIDSTETVTINATYNNFATGYNVEGSPNSTKIKELTLKQIELQNQVNALAKLKLTNQLFEDSLNTLINTYKDEVKIQYIYAAPNTTAAYYALFQRINNYLLFDPLNNKEDIKSFAAVATSLESFYPHAERSKNLYNLVIKGLRNTRTTQGSTLEIPEDMIKETGLIDIELRDARGNIRKLTDLAGKAVLLDFTVYQADKSPERNLMLRELYDKYADKGFEIYQISYDADEHFWKTSASNLPWVCVRDPQGIYSSTLNLYSVQQFPTWFLINKANELSVRGEEVEDLDKTIKALL